MARDLSALFAPESVAVVGASDDPVKWGNWLARGALRGERRRRVYLVNRRGGEVMGRRAYRALSELLEPAELAVLAVPPAVLEPTVDEDFTLEKGFPLGRWVAEMRRRRTAKELTTAQAAQIDALPGWRWE